MQQTRLLKLALPLVRTHGFTREALARSVLQLPAPETHTDALPDAAVSALFGSGDQARKTVIDAWLTEGIHQLQFVDVKASARSGTTVRELLRARLAYNEPVLGYLPEAFALMASPVSGSPPLDPIPGLKHATGIANQVCYISGDTSLQMAWYTRRASLAAIYMAAELHQLTSPKTAYAFLDSLFESSSSLESTLGEVSLFSNYIIKSWKGIIKSSGIL
ncbi:uncharacterized protein LACBIDRAFT_318031 [Laccaria bicolor S238N-H82]|uniref:Ubiquinone biosynthesis protein n=1 Tax=Laccaria bicolor (strain S238N-H82 / ATCC MYA-4686) TaxID=486041 RepID=B0D5T6_LACBS|nr:uncharacterized protein LACBIDRAFT_318031 [Laccaria bicolor S238N-H82]EDR10076.1 predicted protein [Laccaria bicolor S238N-H82]|eukprot:XP_001879461.1 predicted protein [Laccaria bicolor S238N-H82]